MNAATERMETSLVGVMLFAAFLISTSSVWVRLAQMAPTPIGFYRMAIGGGVLVLLCLLRGVPLWRNAAYAGWLFIAALFFAADLWLWHRSIVFVGPGLATVLGNFQVFFMTLFGVLFLKEKIGVRFLFGLALTLSGLFLLVGVDWSLLSAEYRLGVYYGVGTAVAYTGFMLALRHVQSRPGALPAMSNLGVASLLTALILAVQTRIEGHSFAIHDGLTLFSVLALGLLCQVLGWVLITRSMPKLPTSIVGLLLLLQPTLSMVWDVVFFHRPTDAGDAAGLGLVLVGIYLAMLRRRRSRQGAA